MKPYKCDQCEKRYGYSQMLDMHKKFVHQGIRRYACKLCDKRFHLAANVKKHLFTHTGSIAS